MFHIIIIPLEIVLIYFFSIDNSTRPNLKNEKKNGMFASVFIKNYIKPYFFVTCNIYKSDTVYFAFHTACADPEFFSLGKGEGVDDYLSLPGGGSEALFGDFMM